MAFCRDIPSNAETPIPGISNPRDIPNVNTLGDENPEMKRNSESRGLKF